MMNLMSINGTKAFIQYDQEIDMFRGEFIGLNGGADFYAKDIDSLKKEAEISLKVFLNACKEKGINPYKNFSGKLNITIAPQLHEEAMLVAKSQNISLDKLVSIALQKTIS
ncbi:type II toxin-antitoxin system HicB family antitoxin [Candidatus Halobeggiatoa sp. HSG11]|nr:type II toxin-antitoxin system HicB family antitoxin [Candidatus Halobeggiatoa sp. HSG11]